MEFQIGVLGATGYIAAPYRSEIRDCADEAALIALCARRRDLLDQAAAEDHAQLVTGDWRQVIGHPDVNLVLVATPDALHHEAVMACAAAGKRVICEKPIGLNAREAREMWDACRQAKLAHFVPFWTRYVPVFQRARQLVRNGTLGLIRSIVYRWHNPRPPSMPFTWRDDAALSAAGTLADVGSHAYDTLRWMLTDEAIRVLTHAAVVTTPKPDLGDVNLTEALDKAEHLTAGESRLRKKSTVNDYASIAFEMSSGAVGTMVLSHAWHFRKGLSPELELHGTEASLSVDRLTGTLALWRQDADAPEVEQLGPYDLGNRFARYVFPALRDRAANKATDHPGLDDGWRVQLFTDAALESSRDGRWVDLAEFEAE